MKLKAAILVESGKPLVIEEIESAPLRFGQVLVEIVCSGVCGAQINEIDAVKGPDKFLPHLLGHEAAADVVEVGEGVTSVKPGDRVVCHWRKGAGVHAPTASYNSATRGRINSGWVTTFSAYSVVSENRLTRVPAELDAEACALMGCAITTAMGVLDNDAHLGTGESVAIFGAGGVGLSVVQFAAMRAAHPIVAIDLFDHKLELARRLGATHTINASSGDVEAALKAMVGGAGVDVAVETTGHVRNIEQAYLLTAPQGRAVLVGVPRKGQHAGIDTFPLHFKKVLTGSEGGSCRPDVDIPKLARLMQAGKLDLKPLVSRRYPLEHINDAIGDLRSGVVAGRCIVYTGAIPRQPA